MKLKIRHYEVIVVGGGFAGLSAALWLGRYRRKTLVLSSGPSRNNHAHAVHGYPGIEGVSPQELLSNMQHEVAAYGTPTRDEWAASISRKDSKFVLTTSKQQYTADRLLVATGTSDEKPAISNFERYEGVTAWHCPDCDGREYINQKLVILSWGPQMVDYALKFLPYTSAITVVTHGHKPEASAAGLKRLQQRGITIIEQQITAISGEAGHIDYLTLADNTRLTCDGLFYSIRSSPRTELAEQLGCKVDRSGAVVTNRKQQTSVTGVYAAGDVGPLENLVVVAAATGTIAASNIHKSLM